MMTSCLGKAAMGLAPLVGFLLQSLITWANLGIWAVLPDQCVTLLVMRCIFRKTNSNWLPGTERLISFLLVVQKINFYDWELQRLQVLLAQVPDGIWNPCALA